MPGRRTTPIPPGCSTASPNLYTTAERLEPIPGFMADPTDLPQGCKFAPRCPHCTQRCLEENPALHMLGSHGIKCHMFDGKEAE